MPACSADPRGLGCVGRRGAVEDRREGSDSPFGQLAEVEGLLRIVHPSAENTPAGSALKSSDRRPIMLMTGKVITPAR